MVPSPLATSRPACLSRIFDATLEPTLGPSSKGWGSHCCQRLKTTQMLGKQTDAFRFLRLAADNRRCDVGCTLTWRRLHRRVACVPLPRLARIDGGCIRGVLLPRVHTFSQ